METPVATVQIAQGAGGVPLASMEGGVCLVLRAWQRRFLTGILAPGIRTAALSLPRGNGKSALVAYLALRFLTPGDPLHVAGTEAHIAAASIGQARRTVFRLLRELIENGPAAPDFRFAESAITCHVVHVKSNTRVSVLGSGGKTAQGLTRCPWVFCDEPGSWEVTGGELLHASLQSAQGKPGCHLRAVYCGTLAPSSGGWWHALIHGGSDSSTYVMALEGDRAKWDKASEIRRCNPLMWTFPESRAVLLDERNKARRDTRLKAAFLSYRLNVPTQDESRVLVSIEDWQAVCERSVPARDGRPLVGLDLGGGRAWSAAVALWRNGRCEAFAVAPGVPSVGEQERRDRVPSGTYQRLVDSGVLRIATGRRVPNVGDLVSLVRQWKPELITCDRFRLSELRDAAPGVRLLPRVSRWSESTEDIRALRRLALDGDLAVEPSSRGLLTASLAVSVVANDSSGNVRMVKFGSNNRARDDVAVSLVLAAGALSRAPRRAGRFRLHVVKGAA